MIYMSMSQCQGLVRSLWWMQNLCYLHCRSEHRMWTIRKALSFNIATRCTCLRSLKKLKRSASLSWLHRLHRIAPHWYCHSYSFVDNVLENGPVRWNLVAEIDGHKKRKIMPHLWQTGHFHCDLPTHEPESLQALDKAEGSKRLFSQ